MAGKEYTIVVLSSSPPAPDAYNSPHYAAPTRRVAMPPSSPFAFSPPSSPMRRSPGALASGSRAVSIPENASRGFATVSSLVRSEHFAQQIDGDLAEIEELQRVKGSVEGTEAGSAAARKSTEHVGKNTTAADGERPKPKSRVRKPKADKGIENNKTALDPELRLPRTTRSPFLENGEVQATVEKPTEPTVVAPKLTKSGIPRKPRAKKENPDLEDTEPNSKKTRVTKPKVTGKAGKARKATRNAADAVSAHFSVDKDQANTITEEPRTKSDVGLQHASTWDVPQSPQSRQNAPKQRPPDPLPEGLDLEETVSRRRDWTPSRDTVPRSPSTTSAGKENRPSAPDAMAGNFTHLISNFMYESPNAKFTNNVMMPTAGTSGVTKRRRVELVDLPGLQTTPRASSPEKGKAPKKKPRTITDLVTGQYAPKTANLDVEAVTSDFFSAHTSMKKVSPIDDAAHNAEVQQKKPPRKRSKPRGGPEGSVTKAKPRAKKATIKAAAKPKPVAEKLLSPTSAIVRVNRQEVLFGTSSQLALQESPTTVRQIQQAIKESEEEEENTPYYLFEAPPRWPKLQKIEGKRGLWRESTRDRDGGLLENTEKIYIPESDRTQDLPLLMDVARGEPSLPSGFVDIDDIVPAAPIAISSDLPTPPESQSQKQTVELTPNRLAADEVFEDIDDFGSGLPPSNQNAETLNSFVDIDEFQSPLPSVANQALWTSSKPPASAPVLATAKGSPKRRRGRPPKAKNAIFPIPASAPPPTRMLSPPQQAQRRLPSTPPKGLGRFIDIEEILDSEDEALEAFSPTPPQVRKLQDSPPLPLAYDREPSAPARGQADESGVTPVFRILTSHLEWANIKPSICAAITAHIRSILPTMDPRKPNWYEKILMYDPIILEDFMAYLNSNTKLSTYKRATQKQIKAYNNNLKMKGNAILGVERDDQVLAIEKELEVYMVRDWCQEMSICCIHAKESRGRGSARKGLY